VARGPDAVAGPRYELPTRLLRPASRAIGARGTKVSPASPARRRLALSRSPKDMSISELGGCAPVARLARRDRAMITVLSCAEAAPRRWFWPSVVLS